MADAMIAGVDRNILVFVVRHGRRGDQGSMRYPNHQYQ
jgi:hypothetical protein